MTLLTGAVGAVVASLRMKLDQATRVMPLGIAMGLLVIGMVRRRLEGHQGFELGDPRSLPTRDVRRLRGAHVLVALGAVLLVCGARGRVLRRGDGCVAITPELISQGVEEGSLDVAHRSPGRAGWSGA